MILKNDKTIPFSPDARTFHNIYKLQKHVLLRHQSYLIVFMGNKNLRFWHHNFPFKKYIHVYIYIIPCKFAVNKRQNTNYSFIPVT
jgi:hypothetical protein